jgi:hypothetical protein
MPTLVAGGELRFGSISASDRVVCGVEARTGHGYCWGSNERGQLGDGTTTGRLVPTLVGGGTPRFSGIDAGSSMVCGVEAQTGIGYCWGQNRAGTIGDGTTTDRPLPTVVGGGTPRFSSISAGGAGAGFEACGVEARTGRGYCWGHSRLVPTPLGPSTSPEGTASSVAAATVGVRP